MIDLHVMIMVKNVNYFLIEFNSKNKEITLKKVNPPRLIWINRKLIRRY